jgi:uncharacterized protein with FMN-binding domain
VKTFAAVMLAVMGMAFLQPAGAVVLLTQDQALKEMFPGCTVEPEAVALTADQIAAAKGQLGGKWTLYQSGSKSDDAGENDSVTFYFGIKDGARTGVAVIEVQPGKWGPVTYIVALDLTGKVTNLAVMSYVEQRGRPISTRRFLNQFLNKTAQSPIQVGKDVDAVSGATISSRATAFAVKKVIVLYATVYPAEE